MDRRNIAVTAVALSTVLLGAWASRVDAGPCIAARVPAEFVLPDGSAHPAGTLRVCLRSRLNPVTELQEISVAGNTAGLFQATTLQTEAKEIVHPVLYFRKARNDRWVLLGLSGPSPHRYGRPNSIRFAEPRVAVASLPDANETVIALAAQRVTGQAVLVPEDS